MTIEVKPGWWRMRNGGIAKVVDVQTKCAQYVAVGWTQQGEDWDTWTKDGMIEPNRAHARDLIEYLPDCTGFDWEPEPKYVPWTYETAPVGIVLRDKEIPPTRFIITGANKNKMFINGHPWEYARVLQTWTQLNGKPAGRLV